MSDLIWKRKKKLHYQHDKIHFHLPVSIIGDLKGKGKYVPDMKKVIDYDSFELLFYFSQKCLIYTCK